MKSLQFYLFQPDTPNPDVKAWIVNLTTPKYLFPVELKPTASVDPGSYITHASFYAENGVNLVWLNRNQNVSVMVSCDAQNSYNCTDVSENQNILIVIMQLECKVGIEKTELNSRYRKN